MALDHGSPWLRRYVHPTPPGLRMLCLPHAGGSATFFHRWGHAFGEGVEVMSARYPGRQERILEEPLTEMGQLADALTEELLPFLDTPLVIFGHSMGASLGYEIALRLQDRGNTPPALLMVSGRKAPHLLTPRTIDLNDDDALIAEVLQLGGTDSALLEDPGLRELVLPAIRADFGVVARYPARPGVTLHCPVAAYVGDSDPAVDVESVRAWEQIAPKGFDMRVMPGGHFYLAEREAELISDIGHRLDALQRVRQP
ncbi:thioesterase II family protein [Streptomyces sp. NPDC021093]|uniref:thioesterase II family protein n=1 Tax=Streptomyces sp. NPDC021093 TaxID=3365112 RepID=UPI00378C433C